VIEVADSSLAFDLQTKARLYGAAGIPAYWVIDVQQPCLHRVHEPAGEADALLPALRASVQQLLAALPGS
jgi:Uma2 family endonuclease